MFTKSPLTRLVSSTLERSAKATVESTPPETNKKTFLFPTCFFNLLVSSSRNFSIDQS